jgi:hypothetical protein
MVQSSLVNLRIAEECMANKYFQLMIMEFKNLAISTKENGSIMNSMAREL